MRVVHLAVDFFEGEVFGVVEVLARFWGLDLAFDRDLVVVFEFWVAAGFDQNVVLDFLRVNLDV